MTAKPDVSVLIVNWRSGAMSRALVENVRRQSFQGDDGSPGEVEFVIVDNASGPDEEEHLAALESEDDVQLIRSAQNGGYATAMNVAAEHAAGDWVLVTNPDVMLFRGALAALLEHIRNTQGCGLVGPRGFLDPNRFFQLPPVELPSLWELKSEGLARLSKTWGRCHAEGRSRRAVESWTAVGAGPRSMISGFCFMMRTSLALELGPFDSGYPFYFEDADLCMRLHKRGFTTDLQPRAEAVHFFDRSAGQAREMVMSRYEVSRRRFFAQRYGILGRAAYGWFSMWTSGGHGKGHEFAAVDDLGACDTVPELDVPGVGSYVAEISADPGFVFAAGRLDVTRRFRIPKGVWDGLVPATYYVRFLRRKDLSVLRTVAITKTSEQAPADAVTASAELVHA